MRAGVILTKDGEVALIERAREGQHYYTFPGGGMEDSESLEDTAIWEAQEELGLIVAIGPLVAHVTYRARTHADRESQYYFLAQVTGGEFGTGQGDEMTGKKPSESGTYTPIWVPIAELARLPVVPKSVANLVVKATKEGWPETPVELVE